MPEMSWSEGAGVAVVLVRVARSWSEPPGGTMLSESSIRLRVRVRSSGGAALTGGGGGQNCGGECCEGEEGEEQRGAWVGEGGEGACGHGVVSPSWVVWVLR